MQALKAHEEATASEISKAEAKLRDEDERRRVARNRLIDSKAEDAAKGMDGYGSQRPPPLIMAPSPHQPTTPPRHHATNTPPPGPDGFRKRQLELAEAHGARKAALAHENERLSQELGQTRRALGNLKGDSVEDNEGPTDLMGLAAGVAGTAGGVDADALNELVKDLTSDSTMDASKATLAVLKAQLRADQADEGPTRQALKELENFANDGKGRLEEHGQMARERASKLRELVEGAPKPPPKMHLGEDPEQQLQQWLQDERKVGDGGHWPQS